MMRHIIISFVLMMLCVPAWGAEPTLARVSFVVPDKHRAAFEAAYREKVMPALIAQGLIVSQEQGRPTPGRFTQLFEVSKPSEVNRISGRLQKDATWQAVMQHVKGVLGNASPEVRLEVYAVPLGPVTTVTAGPGRVLDLKGKTGRWRTYGPSDGFQGVNVRSILQDKDGYMWFGTEDGASRYDGKTWMALTPKDGLAGGEIRSMCQDRDGNLWFGGYGGGVSKYDPPGNITSPEITTFTTDEGLAHNSVRTILQDREGYIWVGTARGLSRYDGRTWTTFTTQDGLAYNSIWSSFQDRDGNLWFGTARGVSRYNPSASGKADSQAWTTFTTQDGLAHPSVWSIGQTNDGAMWFGTYGGGVSRYDGQDWMTFTTQDGLAHNTVFSILQDRDGEIWFSTFGGGVSRFNGQTWTTYGMEDGLPFNTATTALQDREGNLWFGTVMGVARYEKSALTTFDLDFIQYRFLLTDRDGHVWIRARGGVIRYDGETFVQFTSEDGLVDGVGRMFMDRAGKIWFGSADGRVSCFDGKTFTTFSVQNWSRSNRIISIGEDKEGHLWFSAGVGSGVIQYDPSAEDGHRRFSYFTETDGLLGSIVYSIFGTDEGDVWFGTNARGLNRYDGTAMSWFEMGEDLVADHVISISQNRDGSLWFGTTSSGIFRFDGTSMDLQTDLSYSAMSILQDAKDALWFGALEGVDQYDGQVVQMLSTEDGLLAGQAWAIVQDAAGDYWIGTPKGVTRYRPPHPAPPPVVVNAVVADRRIEGTSKISIPSTVGLITFEFQGISFKTRPGGLVYRYRLVGHNENWQTTRENRVEYHDLLRGDYTFEVVAVDRDLVYSEVPARVALAVHLPYERIGLWGALSVALVLIVWQAVRIIQRNSLLNIANGALSDVNKQLFQVNTQIKEQSERKSAFLASMSHELRTPMNAIKGFTGLVMRREKSLSERGQENLEKVGQASDHLLEMINDLLDLSKIEAGRMDVNPVSFRVENLVTYCVSTVSPLVPDGVALVQEIEAGVGEAFTDEARVRQMVINLLSNAVKFTEVGEVKITVKGTYPQPLPEGRGGTSTAGDRKQEEVNGKSQRQVLEIAISDTGKGIPEDELGTIFDEYRQVKGSESSVQKGTGLGLSITKKFAELLGGTIGVESEVGKGSVFTVRIPMVYEVA